MAPETSTSALAAAPVTPPPPQDLDADTTTVAHTSSRFRSFWGWTGSGGPQDSSETAVGSVKTETSVVTTADGVSTTTTVTHVELLDVQQVTTKAPSHRPSLGAAPLSATYKSDWPSVAHKAVFAELQAKIAAEAPGDNQAPWNEEDTLNRVLVARNLQVPEAFLMWQGIVAWRKEYQPQVLSEEEAAPYLAQGVVSMCGPDKHGRPCLYALSRKHLIDLENHDMNLRTIVNMMDKAVVESKANADGFIAVIIDQEDVGRKNMDTHLFIGKPGLVQVLQTYYPETLGSCFILHSSWIFRLMWAIISPFLDEKTRSKVHVLAKTEEILQHFDMEALPAELQAKLTASAKKK